MDRPVALVLAGNEREFRRWRDLVREDYDCVYAARPQDILGRDPEKVGFFSVGTWYQLSRNGELLDLLSERGFRRMEWEGK